MPSRRSPAASALSRFWLLACLAPYLFLSVAAEALHNHSPFPQGRAPGAHSSQKIETSGAAQAASSFADCLICQWQSQSQSGLCAFPAQSVTLAVIARDFAAPSRLFTANFAARASIRGPPVA